MSIGTLYEFPQPKARGVLPSILAKYLKLDIKIGSVEDEEYIKNFPLKHVPAFLGADGFVLTEAIAVNLYLLSLAPNSNLVGTTKEDYAQILRWLSFGNSEILSVGASIFSRLLGLVPYNKKQVDENTAVFETRLAVLENHLLNKTYLVGERVSVADLFVATMIWRSFYYLFGIEWRAAHPNITRWYSTVTKQAILGPFFEVNGKFLDKPIEPVFPKKEAKAEKPKAEKKQEDKPKAAEVEEIPAEPKKVAHPLAALGNPNSFPIDEWKRVYSNKETREEALPWFWEHYDASEWSLYKVAYKYNDELTLTFMSNNLIGGFFNRLLASTKYLFGAMVVYGENNNNGIVGAFLIRGQDYKPAFEVGPDWESYEFTKLDPTKEADKELVNDLWAWDKPVVIDGERREVADGKVFK